MKHVKHPDNYKFHAHRCSCGPLRDALRRNHFEKNATDMSRRGFLGGLAGTAAVGSLVLVTASQTRAFSTRPLSSGKALPCGTALNVKPVLTYQIEKRRAKQSWRSYGGLQTRADVNEEAGRIEAELKKVGKIEWQNFS